MENNGAGEAQSPGTRNADVQRPDGTPVRVLVVDDEPSLAELLASVLRYEGWEIRTAADGSSAVRTAREFQPDAILLDVMLPDFDGLEVLRRVRAILPHVCVLFLTARDSVQDRVSGITAGGDDYVTKPFSIEELVARIRVVLRRHNTNGVSASAKLVLHDLELDDETHEVFRGGAPVDLTRTEFRLLRYLMMNSGRVLSRTQILDHVWDYDFGGDASVLETYISYLRRKVDQTEPPLIHTVRGVGYVMRVPRATAAQA
jgi:two-component system OmpR family response regulator